MENYYKILHVANFAEIEVVKASYKAMTKLYHPDINKNVNPEIMVKINLAYEILGNQQKKNKYDQELLRFLNETEKKSNDMSSDFKTTNKRNGKDDFINEDYTTNKKSNTSIIGKILDSIVENFHYVKKVKDDAYFIGIGLSDNQLVRKYIKSYGYERLGYEQALLERGLLEKNSDGKIVSTYIFREICKYI